MRRLGIDVDGVIANFSGKFVELANKRYGTEFTVLDQHDWDFKPWFTKQQVDEVWERDIIPTKNFWMTLNVLEGASRLRYANSTWDGLRSNVEPVFITARVPTAGHSVREQTCAWLRQNFQITYPFVIVVDQPSEKIPLCKNLGIACFIDDKSSTVRQMHNAGFKSYLKMSPYNAAESYPEGVVPVEFLNEFLEQELKIG